MGMTDRARRATDFMAPDASRMARSRRSGSAMCVARLTRLRVAWVVNSVLPDSRSEIGMVAMSGFFGMPPRWAR